MQIPRPVISEIAIIFSDIYRHSDLNSIFFSADAPGDPPDRNKQDKTIEWLLRCNEEGCDSLKILGKVLEEYMERVVEIDSSSFASDNSYAHTFLAKRQKLHDVLGRYGLKYIQGGIVYQIGVSSASQSLEQLLKSKNIPAIEIEFKRALEEIEKDPPASLTAACSIVESFCKVYLEERKLDAPKDVTIKPLWAVVAKDLGFDPSRLEDDDLKRILGGLSSIVDGVGALRTHAGSAHGRGKKGYKIQSRHARLAVHAAHTLVLFALETWEQKNRHSEAKKRNNYV